MLGFASISCEDKDIGMESKAGVLRQFCMAMGVCGYLSHVGLDGAPFLIRRVARGSQSQISRLILYNPRPHRGDAFGYDTIIYHSFENSKSPGPNNGKIRAPLPGYEISFRGNVAAINPGLTVGSLMCWLFFLCVKSSNLGIRSFPKPISK